MGNRVKGRVKRKSIKAASHSGMGSKRKLSRMGKKQKRDHAGVDATFIGRAACLKRLQISLKDFRRLCILKGVYPREPRRAPSKKKGQVYYHIKDVRAIAHEPVLHKFREFRAFMKKVRKAAGRNEKDEAARKHAIAPQYTLHHLVRERYPRFADALGDVDDALTLVYLFAALPSSGRIKSKVTSKAQRLAADWGAYAATTSSITKSFISVKGIYFEACIQKIPIRWVVPHAFTQNLPNDVDYRVMLTFFEFYETLLEFVLYKLYSDLGVRYPIPTALEMNKAGGIGGGSGIQSLLAANLAVLSSENSTKNAVTDAVTQAIQKNTDNDNNAMDVDDNDDSMKKKLTRAEKKKKRELLKSVDSALTKIADDDSETDEDNDDDEEEGGDALVAAPLKAALESMEQDREANASGVFSAANLDEDATKRRRLFAGLTFFLSREVPRGYLELACLSHGAKVGWEGVGSPITASDPSITHHIVDRPKLPSTYETLPKSREYIQPQWILDSANFMFLLPCYKYAVAVELPPHLSPWVNDEDEGYKPAYAEIIERLKNGEVVEDAEFDAVVEADDNKEPIEDDDASEENVAVDAGNKTDEESDEDEPDEKEVEKKQLKRKKLDDEEAHELARVMMSKKASRLYGRMQHGIEQKNAQKELLNQKRKKNEFEGKEKSQEGATILKQKVERLKSERREIEKQYKDTGGSMKRSKKKKKTSA